VRVEGEVRSVAMALRLPRRIPWLLQLHTLMWKKWRKARMELSQTSPLDV